MRKDGEDSSSNPDPGVERVWELMAALRKLEMIKEGRLSALYKLLLNSSHMK